MELCINDFTFTATHESTLSSSLSAQLTFDVQLIPPFVIVFFFVFFNKVINNTSHKKIRSVALDCGMTITNPNWYSWRSLNDRASGTGETETAKSLNAKILGRISHWHFLASPGFDFVNRKRSTGAVHWHSGVYVGISFTKRLRK